MKHFTFKALVLFAFIFCALGQVKAQTSASITGVVADSTGAVIPGVSVTLQNPSTSLTYQAVTNSVGSYVILNVQPGPGYKITFSRDGFAPFTITDLYLNVNATRTQNATLKVGGAAQTVEVSAETEGVTLNTTDATIGNSVEVQYINNLPVQNRDSPSALFYQQPGTTLSGSVTGARTDQSNVTVDGLDVNDIFTGNFGSIAANAPVDSVQEFRGVTAGEMASAGKGGGGQYSLVTRSGTNRFHGNLNEYHRDTQTTANDWFNNNAGLPRPKLIRNQFGGNIGGPIKRDKAFFFFNWDSRRDTLFSLVERTVPTDAFRAGTIVYYTDYASRTTATADATQIMAIDPQGVGFNSNVLSVFTGRYPKANDITGRGDHINTAGFKFNAPLPYVENNYVGRFDYNLTNDQKIWAKVGFSRVNRTRAANQFPGDPQTFPFLDKSYQWVIGHNWAIGSNKTNQVWYGAAVTDWSFPNTYNPTGENQYSFGGNGTGGTILSAPYASAINAQSRVVPIPVIGDDFAWQKGRHNIQIGGTIKYINPDSNTILDYNSPTLGLGGNTNNLSVCSTCVSLRPSNIDANSSTARALWDRAFTLALGRFAATSATYNYNNKGSLLPQATGSQTHYRFFETELYVSDSWKVTPSLTLTAGLRWQNYTSPYEKNGLQSVPNLNFDEYFSARVKQSADGTSGNAAVPLISYSLGGKTNSGPGYFQSDYKNFGPRLGFAYSPGGVNSKTVFTGGAGIIYDYTVVSAVLYQAQQYSYLFQSSANLPLGNPADPRVSLLNDPRFAGFSSTPPLPTAPASLKAPYTPFVSNGVPFGLQNGQAFNEAASNNLKTPYNIMFNFGVQQQLPQGFILKMNYVGRLGRRLLAQADANQLIDFPDKASGQLMSQAFANITQQMRSTGTVTPQPWFEDMLSPGVGPAFGFNNNTELVAYGFDPLPYRGDFADTIQGLASLNVYGGYFPPNNYVFPSNVGMGSQFSEFTYYNNMGFSNYHGLLVTLHKNAGHGIQFDLNYTFSHSIDNVSVIANSPAIGGYGFICDVLRPRNCRGNSDFDVTQYFNGQFVWELPVGRGRQFAATAPFWMNEIIGGWDLSGVPVWHTGNTTFATSNAFVAGYANDAPAILTGNIADLQSKVHKAADGTVWAFKKSDNSYVNDFAGPIGFNIGSRNNLRGPRYFNLDLGVQKTFPILSDNRLNLKFRCDAYNALNHPSFSTPDSMNNLDITETSGTFGVLNSTASTARVLQGALRLEF